MALFLNLTQQNSIERFIQSGRGFVSVHAAAGTEHDWVWYGRLVGTYFVDHPGNHNVIKTAFKLLITNILLQIFCLKNGNEKMNGITTNPSILIFLYY